MRYAIGTDDGTCMRSQDHLFEKGPKIRGVEDSCLRDASISERDADPTPYRPNCTKRSGAPRDTVAW